MMDELKKTPAELEQEFYSKDFYMSYSGLNKLLYSPKVWYKHYVLQQREEKVESYLIDGKVIHCLLLNDGSFEDNFVLLPSTLPTGNSRIVIDRVHSIVKAMDPQPASELKLSDLSTEILEILKSINLHQSLKTDEQRLAKIITEENITYFEFLKSKGNRDIIDSETLQRCAESVDVLRADTKICQLLGLLRSEMDNIDILNEIELSIDKKNTRWSFGLKGIADSIQVNYDEKIVYLNDLKTTSKTISEFNESIQFYNYHLQAALYMWLVEDKFKDVVKEDWKIVFNFIVIDKYQQVYCFHVSDATMMEWKAELGQKLNEASWHYTNRNYKLPYKFAIGPVIL